MKYSAVIGLNYGDEGKGLVTDWLCHRIKERNETVTIVKHNGGSQAGHTVTLPSKERFVYSQLGAGSFIPGSITYFAETFIINPVLLLAEMKAWEKLNNISKEILQIEFHPRARISLELDLKLNQLVENKRNHNRHGSCGHGINETVTRNEDIYGLNISEILSCSKSELGFYLKHLKDTYFLSRAIKLQVHEEFKEVKYDPLEEALLLSSSIKETRMKAGFFPITENVIFEGSQGMLLDELANGFPHVTRSRTGFTNPHYFINKWSLSEKPIEVYAVSRCYTTRHGAGTLIKEDPNLKYEDETNAPNQYQGTLRFSPQIWIGNQLATIRPNCNTLNLVLTCCDQVKDGEINVNGCIYNVDSNRSMIELKNDLKVDNIFLSYGPTRDTMRKCA